MLSGTTQRRRSSDYVNDCSWMDSIIVSNRKSTCLLRFREWFIQSTGCRVFAVLQKDFAGEVTDWLVIMQRELSTIKVRKSDEVRQVQFVGEIVIDGMGTRRCDRTPMSLRDGVMTERRGPG